VLVLDSLEDPQNFGSLLRTAEASGVHGVVFPTHRQAPLSAAAVKASAGAVEHLLLVPVEDLAEALTDLHVRGLRIVGSDAEASLTARQADLRGPVAIVVGSEGQGLGPAVRRRCDTVVRIPMHGHIESLNASVAGSILLYEAASQRGGDKASVPLAGESPAPTAAPPDESELQVSLEAPEPAALPEASESPAPPAAGKPKRATRSKKAAVEPEVVIESEVAPEPADGGDHELLP
jgi:tRNA(Leu) C34 or U34 (ribose-2'-O)-methylase TrmL